MDNHLENLAKDIYFWCKKHDLWEDNCLYYNGIALAAWADWHGVKGEKIADDLYLYRDKDPRNYFPGEGSVLSMSFEGALNHVLNAYVDGWGRLDMEFRNLFRKYGLYFEMYHSWNGNAYPA